MSEDEIREEISRLEAQIEELAAAIENCRKIALAAKAAIALGGILLLLLILDVVRFDAVAFMAGTAALLGGIVLLGSNTGTARVKTGELKAAEAERAKLIDRINLTVVGKPDNRLNGPESAPVFH
jgi:hypothetical protein